MLKPIIISVLLSLTSLSVFTQNLVLNPSFEETDCDAETDDFFFPALHWYNVINSSPNYVSTSLGQGECYNGVPTGGQSPRTGTFMAGLWGSQIDSPTRDYIQSQLSEAMVEDSTYCIEVYILRTVTSPLAINRFGVQLSQDSLYDFSISGVLIGGVVLDNPSGEFLTDAVNWIRLSWEYVAEGGEEFVTIGNFKEESDLEYIDVEGTDSFPLAYYFVDDISIQKCTSTFLSEHELSFSIGANPISNYLKLTIEEPVDWVVYSMDGRLVKRGRMFESGQIDLRSLTSALYLFHLENNKGGISTALIYKD